MVALEMVKAPGAGSLKSILSDCGLLLADAVVDVKAAAFSVKLTLDVSLALACDEALPVNDIVNCVDESRVTTNVRPVGTPVTVYSSVLLYVPDVNVSFARVMVLVAIMLPSFVAASTNEVPL